MIAVACGEFINYIDAYVIDDIIIDDIIDESSITARFYRGKNEPNMMNTSMRMMISSINIMNTSIQLVTSSNNR